MSFKILNNITLSKIKIYDIDSQFHLKQIDPYLTQLGLKHMFILLDYLGYY